VASGAGAGFLAGVFDVDVVLQQDVAHGLPCFGFDHGAFGAKLGMRQDDDLWHFYSSVD
jgi:hypothetical protein